MGRSKAGKGTSKTKGHHHIKARKNQKPGKNTKKSAKNGENHKNYTKDELEAAKALLSQRMNMEDCAPKLRSAQDTAHKVPAPNTVAKSVLVELKLTKIPVSTLRSSYLAAVKENFPRH